MMGAITRKALGPVYDKLNEHVFMLNLPAAIGDEKRQFLGGIEHNVYRAACPRSS